MKRIFLIFALVAVTTAQKHGKNGKHGKPYFHGGDGGGGGGNDHSQSQYHEPQQYNSGQVSKSYGGSNAPEAKPAYAQLLTDTRTLNQDGTINFNFQADNGLQQGESVDADGTRRGFYSYPGADGKPITVKYTAGKNGFVAEGDHLPLQPQAAAHSDNDDGQYNPKEDGRGKKEGRRDSGHYNPPSSGSYRGGSGGGSSQYSRPSPVYNHKPAAPKQSGRYQGGPSFDGPYSSPYSGEDDDGSYSEFPRGQGFASPQTSFNSYAGPQPKTPARGAGAGRHQGGAPSYSNYGGPSFGSSNNGPSYNPAPAHSPKPSYSSGGGGSSHGGYTADNPYQATGSANYHGKFDLGNGGHYSINFTPGSAQEYQPGQQGSSHAPNFSPSPVYVGARPGASGRRGPSGSRGQY